MTEIVIINSSLVMLGLVLWLGYVLAIGLLAIAALARRRQLQAA